jgi:transposase
MPSTAVALPIAAGDLATLHQWAQASSIPAALAQRAKILLLAADGLSNTDIAAQLGVSRPTGIGWRRRYAREGLAGLTDRPRPGRPQTVRRDRRAEILATTLTPPPQRLGITHWSSRLLAGELGL